MPVQQVVEAGREANGVRDELLRPGSSPLTIGWLNGLPTMSSRSTGTSGTAGVSITRIGKPTRPVRFRPCADYSLYMPVNDVAAEFWLLDAPDSIAHQSEVNADGYGMAALTAEEGSMLIRNSVQASADKAYQHIARRLEACEMIVHLRYADTGKTALVIPSVH